MSQFADVIRLGIFGHTHMDEIRVLEGTGSARGWSIPIKIVPAMATGGGNASSFIAARADPRRGIVTGYDVYAASSIGNDAEHWYEEYRFGAAYGVPDFSGKSVSMLVRALVRDRGASSNNAISYMKYFSPGVQGGFDSRFDSLSRVTAWDNYSCLINISEPNKYLSCAC
jgi:sphingomyelin phosphodiesterase acid-like 3